MHSLSEIADGISNGSIIQASAFEGLDIDSLLDQRDSPEFEDEWLRVSKEVQAKWSAYADSETEIGKIDRIRELAFKKCFEFTGESEISGYVSDDFELIAKASAMSFASPFLEEAMKKYLAGAIPA